MREGKPSIRFASLGVYNHCLGPNAPILRGERSKIVIYDESDNIIRRLEEVRGECFDSGYVTFFLGPESRTSKYKHYLVDTAPDGIQTLLHDNPAYLATRPDEWFSFVGDWAKRHTENIEENYAENKPLYKS